jgi:hypothetical protein
MAGELVVSTINGAGFDGANVIYNPEFTINQRGAASRTATTGYNFDRWYYDGTRLLQGVEGNNLRAGTYVISWSGSSTAEFSLNTAAASGQGSESYTAVTNGGTITIASVGSNNLWVRFSSDLTNLTRVKLSPGTEASGFVARPYGTELALCQRYVFVTDGSSTTTGAVSNSATGQVQQRIVHPVPMRASPSVTVNTSGSWVVSNDFNADYTAATMSIFGSNSSTQVSRVGIGGFSGLPATGTSYLIIDGANNRIDVYESGVLRVRIGNLA